MNSEIFILMYHEIVRPAFIRNVWVPVGKVAGVGSLQSFERGAPKLRPEVQSLTLVSLSRTCLRTLHLFSKPLE